VIDAKTLARELMEAYAQKRILEAPPSSRDPGFDLATAYAVEGELVRLRAASGHSTAGLKVGFANKAIWRVLKLETLLWAHLYDDTVRYAENNAASLALGPMCAPKIEPEIVFKMRAPLAPGADAAVALEAVEWLALGFEIVDCVFAGWTFQPADFVAAYGLHAALIVGAPRRIEPALIPGLVEQLPRFKLRLLKDGQLVAEGSGKNSLRSPALCLAELASALPRQPAAVPLAAGELVSTGTLTDAHPLTPGETWTAEADGLELPALTLHTTER
jgi:2-oxo-3-hexenedioate decarboxylase